MPLYRAELLAKKPLPRAALIHDVSQVLHLPFDYDDGSYARDRSGYNRHGIIYGTTLTAGKIGMARSLDGTDDYVEVPHNLGAFDGGHGFAISIWVYPLTWVKGIRIYEFRRNYYLYVWYNGAELQFVTFDGVKDWIVSDTSPPTASWVHYVFLATGAAGVGHLELWKNGTKIDSTTDWYIKPTAERNILGAREDLATGTFFKGIIDEVRVYKLGLSQDEIRMLMYRRLWRGTVSCLNKV